MQPSHPDANPDSTIREYFEFRTHLGSLLSEFRCDPDCTRPGCKNTDMHISATVFDLIGAARVRNEPVKDLFSGNYSLNVIPFEGHGWIHPVSLKLRKPCPYLEAEKCSIYGVRPLPCIFFPEWYLVDGTLSALLAQARFREYACFRHSIQVSEERTKILRKLGWMMDREVLLSDYYLFHDHPFWVDFSNLEEDLLNEVRDSSCSENRNDSESPQEIPFERLERIFDKALRGCPPLNEVEERILKLDDRETREKLFANLQNRAFVKKLMQKKDSRPLVFRLERGKLVGKRKSLLSAEYRFL